MQAASHVNRICLPQSVVSVHCFRAYSKGSRVSLQSTQTSWTFPWLRVLLSYYLSLSTTCALLQPCVRWQNCLFRPCWVERPVLKGILLLKLIPHVTFFYRRTSLNWGYMNLWHAQKPTQCCRKLWERQGHKHNQCNNSVYAHTGCKKTDTKQSTKYWKRSSDVVNTKSKVNL